VFVLGMGGLSFVGSFDRLVVGSTLRGVEHSKSGSATGFGLLGSEAHFLGSCCASVARLFNPFDSVLSYHQSQGVHRLLLYKSDGNRSDERN
jgi:hypothetical protein